MLDSPYFEPRISVFDDPNENKTAFDLNNAESPTFFNLRDAASPSGCQSSSSKNEQDPVGRSRESIRHETPSPSSGNFTNQHRKAAELCRFSFMDYLVLSFRYISVIRNLIVTV